MKKTEQTDKIKVLIVNTVRFRLSGITNVIMNYYEHIDLKNIKIDFVVNTEIIPFYKNVIDKRGSKIFILQRNKKIFKYMLSLFNIIRDGSYDVVHIHGNSGTMIIDVLPAKIAGIGEIIVHCHNTKCTHSLLNTILKIPMIKMSDCLLACSEEAGRFLYGNNRFFILKNAIDIKKFVYDEKVRDDVRNEMGIDDQYVIGHIGHFTEQKNHVFLINVFKEFCKKYPESKLLLVSDGPLFDEIKEIVENYGLTDKVIFAGRRTDIERMYQAMDIFILPSLWEGLPLVLLEAQAAGMPVIVSENVTLSAKCSDLFEQISLKETVTEWINKINKFRCMNYDRKADQIYKNIRKNGFDIWYECEELEKIYKQVLIRK